ncbi:MAG: class I SAM-dependent methyltransferase [Halobacteriota archaeon]|jgi:ubiquinone/menaquinone biosynthesis C-methylase UbiE
MKSASVSKPLKTFYDEYYGADYTTDGRLDLRWLDSFDKARNITSLCDTVQHARILDIGCGDGAVLKRLSDEEFGRQFYGLEISPTGLALTKKRAIKNLVECKLYDGYQIPYGDDQFDLAVLSHVVEHLEHPRMLLREARRVATHVFLEVPLEDHLRQKRDYFSTDDVEGHINPYSLKTVRWLVQTCGFEIVRQTVTIPSFEVYHRKMGAKMFFLYPPFKLAGQLVPGVATKIFTYHCAILCRRAPSSSRA